MMALVVLAQNVTFTKRHREKIWTLSQNVIYAKRLFRRMFSSHYKCYVNYYCVLLLYVFILLKNNHIFIVITYFTLFTPIIYHV